MNKTSHSDEALAWIDEQFKRMGICDYRLCSENDCYACDKNGNFYSVCVRQLSKSGRLVERYDVRQLKGSADRYGYVTYRVSVNGIKKHLKGHRMMLNAWVSGNPLLVVNHKDGNKHNNALSNLEWCTVAENNAHAIAKGLFDPRGAKHKHLIPYADWVTIYYLNKHMGISLCELARKNRCSRGTITSIIQRLDRVFAEEANGA